MDYRIIFEKAAVKFLQKQPSAQQKRIMNAIRGLPSSGDIKAMQGHECLYRLRVGSYRVIYRIENDVLIIIIVNIGNRGDVYKK